MGERRGPPSGTLCRFYMNGTCSRGANCQFSHERLSATNLCRFYLRGNCTYGRNCRFDHSQPPNRKSHEHRPGSRQQPSSAGRKAAASTGVKESSNDVKNLQEGIRGLSIDADPFVPRTIQDQPCSSQTVTQELCPTFSMVGKCPNDDHCSRVHGLQCDMCLQYVLYPDNNERNADHRKNCLAEHEKEMEVAFTIARSSSMQCGICMETIMDKPGNQSSQFGILSNCRHCFCLECIRKWRKTEEFDAHNTRACPQCRVISHFVIPSPFWVDSEEERKVLIEGYKSNLKTRTCRYHDLLRNRECPFGNQCFYKHVNPDGSIELGDSPRTVRRRIRRANRDRRRHVRNRDSLFNLGSTNRRRNMYDFFFALDDDDRNSSYEDFDFIAMLGRDAGYSRVLF